MNRASSWEFAEDSKTYLRLVLRAQHVRKEQLGEWEIRPQLEGAASVEQRQVDRLGLVYDAREIKEPLGKAFLGAKSTRGGGGSAGLRASTDSASSLPELSLMNR